MQRAPIYIQENYYKVADVENISDLVEREIEKFKFYLSILLIKNKVDMKTSHFFLQRSDTVWSTKRIIGY